MPQVRPLGRNNWKMKPRVYDPMDVRYTRAIQSLLTAKGSFATEKMLMKHGATAAGTALRALGWITRDVNSKGSNWIGPRPTNQAELKAMVEGSSRLR
jgi:hypothetical protein